MSDLRQNGNVSIDFIKTEQKYEEENGKQTNEERKCSRKTERELNTKDEYPKQWGVLEHCLRLSGCVEL